MTFSNVRIEGHETTYLNKRERGIRALLHVKRPEIGWQAALGPNAWVSLVPLDWLKFS
jgi:hypothetical protein